MKDNSKADVLHTDEFDKMYQEMVKQAEDKYKVKSEHPEIEEEGLVEEETKPLSSDELRKKAIAYSEKYRLAEPNEKCYLIGGYEGGFKDAEKEMQKNGFNLPNGYQFVDENGNVINAKKIVLEKKKKEYPKTFLGCCDVLGIEDLISRGVNGYKSELLNTFQKLLICRDAYWKLYGEEMGLGKPLEPNTCQIVYSIGRDSNRISFCNDMFGGYFILEFPTADMRDAFYENFKSEIEICKKLL